MKSLDTIDQPILRLAPPVEIKLAGAAADEGIIAGIASPYGGPPDLYGDIVNAGAYTATITQAKASGYMPPMLFSHDLARPIGRWLELREEPAGLYARGQINLASTEGREAFAHLRARSVTGLSIGFRLPEGGYEYRADGVRLLHRIDLAEISVVTMPAAPAARVTEIKSFESVKTQRELERWLHDQAGLSRKDARAVAARGYAGIAGSDQDEAAVAELLRRMERATAEIKAIEITPRYR